jgi:hypothetical protein
LPVRPARNPRYLALLLAGGEAPQRRDILFLRRLLRREEGLGQRR